MGTTTTTTPLPIGVVATLKQQTVSAIVDGLAGVLQGAASDIQAFVIGITHDTIAAASVGDTDTLNELKAQRQLLLEINRIRVAEGADVFFNRLLDVTLGLAANLVAPGTGSLATMITGLLQQALPKVLGEAPAAAPAAS